MRISSPCYAITAEVNSGGGPSIFGFQHVTKSELTIRILFHEHELYTRYIINQKRLIAEIHYTAKFTPHPHPEFQTKQHVCDFL